MFRSIVKATALLTALVLTVGAGNAFAQACVGVPAPQGAFALSGAFGMTDGSKGYGGGVTANLRGPVSVQAGYMLTNIDGTSDNMNSFAAGLGAELPNLGFSACPWAGVEYSTWSSNSFGADVDVNLTTIPLGFGLGTTFDIGPNSGLSLYAMPQFLYMRGRVSVSDGFESVSESDSNTEFGTRLGFALRSGALFGGASVGFTTVDESDPVYGLSFGVIVGR